MFLPSMSRHGGERFSSPCVILVTWPPVASTIGWEMAGTANARETRHRSRWGSLPRHGARDCLIDNGRLY